MKDRNYFSWLLAAVLTILIVALIIGANLSKTKTPEEMVDTCFTLHRDNPEVLVECIDGAAKVKEALEDFNTRGEE